MNLLNLNCITQQVAVTATATRIKIDGDEGTVRIVNTGTNTVFVAIGGDTVTATPAGATPNRTSLAIVAGAVETFSRTSNEANKFLSFVCAATLTSTVVVSFGNGE